MVNTTTVAECAPPRQEYRLRTALAAFVIGVLLYGNVFVPSSRVPPADERSTMRSSRRRDKSQSRTKSTAAYTDFSSGWKSVKKIPDPQHGLAYRHKLQEELGDMDSLKMNREALELWARSDTVDRAIDLTGIMSPAATNAVHDFQDQVKSLQSSYSKMDVRDQYKLTKKIQKVREGPYLVRKSANRKNNDRDNLYKTAVDRKTGQYIEKKKTGKQLQRAETILQSELESSRNRIRQRSLNLGQANGRLRGGNEWWDETLSPSAQKKRETLMIQEDQQQQLQLSLAKSAFVDERLSSVPALQKKRTKKGIGKVRGDEIILETPGFPNRRPNRRDNNLDNQFSNGQSCVGKNAKCCVQ